ncbi:MAG: hypothetical protein M3348_04410, partial [Acidobacteriota bacterium]|nr:hypothetical protein [Acidobacteriota bacterium]
MSLPESLPVLAKPSLCRITLDAHTQRVRNEAARVVDARPFVCRKYRQRTGEDLPTLLDRSAFWHDQGKRHPRWQGPCQEDYRESVRTGKDCGSRIRRAGIRHELVS